MPSRKLQAKGEIACMTAACLRLSSSLVICWLRAGRMHMDAYRQSAQ